MARNDNDNALRFALLVVAVILIGLLIATLVGVWCVYRRLDIDVEPKVKVHVQAPPPVIIPPPVVNLTCPPHPAHRNKTCAKWVYAVPFVCGTVASYDDVALQGLVDATYAWTMTVFNAANHTVAFEKKISETIIGNQTGGPVFPLRPMDSLEPCQALEMSCVEIFEFDRRRNGSLFKGIVSVTAYGLTDIRAPPLKVFKTGSSDRGGQLMVRDEQETPREYPGSDNAITLVEYQIKPECGEFAEAPRRPPPPNNHHHHPPVRG